MIHTMYYDAPVGRILLAERDGGLIGLWIEGQKYYLSALKDEIVERDAPILSRAADWLDAYFAGQRPPIAALTLAPIGSEFRQAVWRLLCEIPYGETTTYGALAAQMAAQTGRARMSAQAIGGAVGHNPVSIIIPCHRVVGTGGSLTGYAGGIATKIKLLTHEGADMSGLFTPKKGTAL